MHSFKKMEVIHIPYIFLVKLKGHLKKKISVLLGKRQKCGFMWIIFFPILSNFNLPLRKEKEHICAHTFLHFSLQKDFAWGGKINFPLRKILGPYHGEGLVARSIGRLVMSSINQKNNYPFSPYISRLYVPYTPRSPCTLGMNSAALDSEIAWKMEPIIADGGWNFSLEFLLSKFHIFLHFIA